MLLPKEVITMPPLSRLAVTLDMREFWSAFPYLLQTGPQLLLFLSSFSHPSPPSLHLSSLFFFLPMSCPTSPTAPLVISAKPFDMSMSGPPPGLSSNIPPSDAMNIDLPPQSEHTVLPSLGIPPTPALPPPAPMGSPTA
ncbi:hypothetical protein ARMGADRAFT_1084753 [Armillaria gallica]|uniref:Uncharacterized protein n=1 Tax=Armillaria gallica TaxID=47427 RepID=A0A2H3DH67_ARMGA|nr:hypothetical protein ARMGADRAFT_1084753 [Armillaria gallica]